MGVSELRVGNIFKWSEFASMGFGEDIVTINNIGYSQLMEPVKLTEQWLIDFGMEMPTNEDPIFEHGKGEYDDCFNHFKKTSQSLIDASFEYDGKEFWADSEGFWFSVMHTYTKIEYVHQFQNLIFALTGKELTLQK